MGPSEGLQACFGAGGMPRIERDFYGLGAACIAFFGAPSKSVVSGERRREDLLETLHRLRKDLVGLNHQTLGCVGENGLAQGGFVSLEFGQISAKTWNEMKGNAPFPVIGEVGFDRGIACEVDALLAILDGVGNYHGCMVARLQNSATRVTPT